MSDDHNNWVSQRDLELVSERGHFLFLDLRKLPEEQIDKSHAIAGSGPTKYDPIGIQRLIDLGTIELRPANDPAWGMVGGHDAFLQKHGLTRK